jgi:DNA-binding NarL/FixJ family response regulator
MNPSPRALLVDDHPCTGHALRAYLERTSDTEAAGEVQRGRDLPPALRRIKPDP